MKTCAKCRNVKPLNRFYVVNGRPESRCKDCEKARRRHREHIRYTSVSDITPVQEAAMRKRARKCLLCRCGLTSKPGQPNSKHLDHIVPLNVGGTHTHGNVRIICSACNLKRPKDGSDYAGPVTLWAQGEVPVRRPHGLTVRAASRKTCLKGLHPWVPENIVTDSHGKRRCRLCRNASHPLASRRECTGCGTPVSLRGNLYLCPSCAEDAGWKAAELHANGLTWDEIAPQVGYSSAWGAAYAAKRIGYEPAPRPAAPKARPQRLCPDCGMPKQASQCQPCATARAWRAVELRLEGKTLREIASQLGYTSMTSVTNLLKTVVDVEPYARSVTVGDDYRETCVNA